jgi:hypothetical protein
VRYVILRHNILDDSEGRDWLLRHDVATGQFWIVYHDEAASPNGPGVPQDEWPLEEAQGHVPAEVWALAIAARERLVQSAPAGTGDAPGPPA